MADTQMQTAIGGKCGCLACRKDGKATNKYGRMMGSGRGSKKG